MGYWPYIYRNYFGIYCFITFWNNGIFRYYLQRRPHIFDVYIYVRNL